MPWRGFLLSPPKSGHSNQRQEETTYMREKNHTEGTEQNDEGIQAAASEASGPLLERFVCFVEGEQFSLIYIS